MLIETPDWAQPGCYGQALTYSDDLLECRGCPFAKSCKVEHVAALQRLRDEHGIKLRVKGVKTVSQPADAPMAPGSAGLALPKKVEDLLQRFAKAGIRVGESFAAGLNPFPPGVSPFMRITAHLLLHLKRGVSREELTQQFEKRLNWSRGTAAPHATQAFQALIALGVAEDTNGRLCLKR